ncbi:hypothetical protein TNCV_199411 [Trichonephila clavipes]|nr:hypothetical protein TNCV_199411 [Trichonephila clavipes]
MVIRSEGAVEYVMVGVSRRPTQAIWRGKEIEPVQSPSHNSRSYKIARRNHVIFCRVQQLQEFHKSSEHIQEPLKFVFKIISKHVVQRIRALLPTEVSHIIAREPDDKANSYEHVKDLLLKRFKLTSEKFRAKPICHLNLKYVD